MFGALFRQAQRQVESTISVAVDKVLMTIPFLVAVAFGAAALTIRLMRDLGSELGLLAMAGLFAVAGLIYAAISAMRTPRVAEVEAVAAEEAEQVDPATRTLDDSDKELLSTALSSLGPIALPFVLRFVMRNLPILIAIAAAAYVFTRHTGESDADLSAAGAAATGDAAAPI